MRCCHSGYKSRIDRYARHVNTYDFATDNTSTWTPNARANPFPRVDTASKVDYDTMQPYFCWLPIGIIKKTFEATTQWAKMPASAHLFKRYSSPHMFANYYRRNEAVASDTIFADVPAIGSGVTCAQIYYGMNITVTDVFGLKKERYFIKSLQDVVRIRGAPNQLLVDSAAVEASEKVLDFLRQLVIKLWQSEPHNQHQNPAERCWQTVKRITNR